MLNLLLLQLCQFLRRFHFPCLTLSWVGRVHLSYIDGCKLICIYHQSSAPADPTSHQSPLSCLTSIQFVCNSIFTPSKTPGLHKTYLWLVYDKYIGTIGSIQKQEKFPIDQCFPSNNKSNELKKSNKLQTFFCWSNTFLTLIYWKIITGLCWVMLELIKTWKYEIISWHAIKQK